MKRHQRSVVEFLAGIGATAIRIEPPRSHGHPRLIFSYAGREWRTNIASSPSDWRAPMLKIRDLRTMLGLTRQERRVGERRRRKPRPPPRRTDERRSTRFNATADLPPLNTPFAELGELLSGAGA